MFARSSFVKIYDLAFCVVFFKGGGGGFLGEERVRVFGRWTGEENG